MRTQVQQIQKVITFSPQLYKLVEDKAKQIGMSFAEYIQALAVKNSKEPNDYPFVDEETEKQIGQGLKDFKEGRYTEIKTKKELDTYLKSL